MSRWKLPKRWEKIWQHKITVETLTVVFALVVGTLIWVYVNSRRSATREVRARVEITTPTGWRIIDTPPRFTNVILRGPHWLMSSLRTDDLRFNEKITPSADGGMNGRASSAVKEVELTLQADNLQGLPREVQVVEIVAPKFSVALARAVRKHLPVEVVYGGELPADYELKNTQISPQYVAVTATEDDFTAGLVVKTRPVDLDGRNKSFVTYVDLQPLRLSNKNLELGDSIFVQLTIAEKSATKIIENVPVSILLATQSETLSGKKFLDPANVAVKVEGSDTRLSTLSERNLTVYLDSRDLGTSIQNEYTLKCRVLPLEDVKILEIIPAEIKLRVENRR